MSRQSIVLNRRLLFFAYAKEEQTMHIRKNIKKDSRWKQRERKEISICSILRTFWRIEI